MNGYIETAEMVTLFCSYTTTIIEPVVDKKDFEISVRDVLSFERGSVIKMAAVLSKQRLLPNYQSTYFLSDNDSSSTRA